MSEREPLRKEPRMSMEINGVSFEMTPGNTAAYLHDEDHQYDHLFYAAEGGYAYVFSRSIANFDEVVAYMKENGYEVLWDVYAQGPTKQAYMDTYGYPEIPTRELTPREEKRLKFAKYLLDMELVTPEDFNGSL